MSLRLISSEHGFLHHEDMKGESSPPTQAVSRRYIATSPAQALSRLALVAASAALAKSSGSPVTITVEETSIDMPLFQAFATAFQAKYPNIKVNVVGQDSMRFGSTCRA